MKEGVLTPEASAHRIQFEALAKEMNLSPKEENSHEDHHNLMPPRLNKLSSKKLSFENVPTPKSGAGCCHHDVVNEKTADLDAKSDGSDLLVQNELQVLKEI